ncbi:MAG TPA: hypothetical protein VNF00_03560 [Candidatus Acidoferrales bacterium]|nr:hypothetical protein [Candidatus Acidoferrales bacterium]
MIAALICVISIAALLQFFISYSRSIIAAHRKSDLSEQVREVVGIEGQNVGSDQFGRLVQLIRLCPQKGDDQADLKIVGVYYWMMGVLRSTARTLAPRITSWAERERIDCAYFVAVALDRRIAYSRDLLAQQMSGQ